KEELRAIARRAMLERGFRPDFSPAARAEARSLSGPARAKSRPTSGGDRDAVRDLEDRLWCSIDNATSRDLDQLTVAELGEGGTTRALLALADARALPRADPAT